MRPARFLSILTGQNHEVGGSRTGCQRPPDLLSKSLPHIALYRSTYTACYPHCYAMAQSVANSTNRSRKLGSGQWSKVVPVHMRRSARTLPTLPSDPILHFLARNELATPGLLQTFGDLTPQFVQTRSHHPITLHE